MARPRILLSGFEAFGSRAVNPTSRLIETLAEYTEGIEAEIRGITLPVTFKQAFARLENEVSSFSPDVIVALGLAGGRSNAIEFERVAINVMDADIPDNTGEQPRDVQIDKSGPAAYFTGLPIRSLVDALKAENVPAKISNSAGTYVCNSLFYRLQQLSHDGRKRSGFIHVPDLPAEASGGPSMSLNMMQAGVRTILRTLVSTMP